MATMVRDARPPAALIRVLNPIMRFALRTQLGRLIGSFALLEFSGRRSGRLYSLPVGWHDADGVRIVLSPAPWRANFVFSAPVVVHHRGRVLHLSGTLVGDPAEVACYINSVLAGGTPARQIGLQVPPGHTISATDVTHVDRKLIRFHPIARQAR